MTTPTNAAPQTNAFGQPKRPLSTGDKQRAAAWAPFMAPLGQAGPTGKPAAPKAAKVTSPWAR